MAGNAPAAQAAPDDDPRPDPPVEPELGECCGSGCRVCVYDRYDDALERYRARLAGWLQRHPQARDPGSGRV